MNSLGNICRASIRLRKNYCGTVDSRARHAELGLARRAREKSDGANTEPRMIRRPCHNSRTTFERYKGVPT